MHISHIYMQWIFASIDHTVCISSRMDLGIDFQRCLVGQLILERIKAGWSCDLTRLHLNNNGAGGRYSLCLLNSPLA